MTEIELSILNGFNDCNVKMDYIVDMKESPKRIASCIGTFTSTSKYIFIQKGIYKYSFPISDLSSKRIIQIKRAN